MEYKVESCKLRNRKSETGSPKSNKSLLRASYFLLPASCFLLLTSSFAANPQEWWKKMGQQKLRKVHSKHTTVAAVRGVDEPNQVDPNARNYEAVAEMEKRTVSQEKLVQFINDGKLVLHGVDGRQPMKKEKP